jgi:hypothetical protein
VAAFQQDRRVRVYDTAAGPAAGAASSAAAVASLAATAALSSELEREAASVAEALTTIYKQKKEKNKHVIN